jgi:hypothetical protein
VPKRICSVNGCRGRAAYGWCAAHWPERFWSKVKRGPVPEHRPELEACWLWMGRRDNLGYGRFDLDRREQLAHRISYQLMVGAIPPGWEIDHLCRVTSCVRAGHLEAVPHRVNAQRGNQGNHVRAKTHCPHGHPYDEANTYWYQEKGRSFVGRLCKECRRQRVNRDRARRRAEARQR